MGIIHTAKTPLASNRKVTFNTPSEVTIGTSNVADASLGWNPSVNYSYALVQNTGATNLFLKYGTALDSSDMATTSVYHTKLTPGTQVDLSDTVGGTLNIISDAAGGKAVFTLASPDYSVSDYPAQPSNNINGY
jgi:hypothetical protein